MTEKITLTPGDVRGLGNIVSHKTEKNFLPVDCRIHTPQQATVDGVTRDVFLVDMSPAGTLVDTYITVDGPSIVELSDEEITFNVALYRSDGVRVKSVPLVCMTGDSVLEVTSNQYGYAEFTVPNTFTEGWYTFTFASQTIVVQDDVRFDNAYRNHSFVVVDDAGEYYFDLISVENPIQTGSVSHLISRFCVDGVGVPASTVYFFEEYVKSVLRCSASLESFVSGETTVLSGELKDIDGSAVQEAPVYFFMESDSTISRATLSSASSQVMPGETITLTVTALDENGYGVPGCLFRLKKGSVEIGYVTTGDDGKATFDYTGEGAGTFILSASYITGGTEGFTASKLIVDSFTYGTDISQFLPNEPTIPRITSDGNCITVYSYDSDGGDGYADIPILFDHVFNSGDKWYFDTTIATPTDISIVAVVGYPANSESEATIITAGHDPRVTDEAGADDPDNTAFVKGTDVEFITHAFTTDDSLRISNNGNSISFKINNTEIDTVNSPNYPYYVGFMATNESPQFFNYVRIIKS